MPGVVPLRRRRDEDDGGSESETSSPAGPDSAKRARLDRNGDRQPALLPSSYLSSGLQDGHTNGTPLQHQPGSIVKVTMRNFVTYTAAEFLPGPSLNMVIGPNGTGKSTLVCAICLGLGSKPDVLGRAKEPSEFVKHGAREAEIEIELARDPNRHRTNPAIKRTIKRDSNNKTFFAIDGRTSSQRAVVELCRSFSIQVDNLCQFLPQDRVVEFAALKPVDLLVHTQRAAAPDHMSEWHENLKQLRRDQVEAQGEQQAITEHLKNLEHRQNSQRGDVERLHERAEIQNRLTALERLRPFPRYRTARNNFNASKGRQNQARRDLSALESECEPALAAVRAKESYVADVNKVVKQRERLVDRANKDADTYFRSQESKTAKINECDNEVEAEKKSVKDHKQERLRLDLLIKDLDRQMSSEPAQIDLAAHNEKSRDVLRQMHEKDNAAREANDKQAECVAQGQSLKQRISAAKDQIGALRSKAGQQTNKLNRVSPDSGKAWEYIQANKSKFSGPVFGPALLECTVKDPKYANVVESLLGQSDMICFTATSKRDFDVLQRELTENLRLSDIHLRTLDTPLSAWKKPMPNEQLSSLGLDTYLLDLIEGPEEILSMLCDNRNVHAIGVAFREISNEQFDLITKSPISNWATPTETYRITRRREYGDEASTSTQRLKPARFFTSQPVDTHAEEELTNTAASLGRDLQELQKQAEGFRAESSRLGREHARLKEEKKSLDEEKKENQEARSTWQRLPMKRDGIQRKLDGLVESARNYRARVQAIKDKQNGLMLERSRDALKLASSVVSLQKLHTDLIQARLVLIEGLSDHDTLQARNLEVRAMLTQRRQDVQQLERETRELKQIATAAMAECNTIIGDMSELEQELYQEYNEVTPDELEVEIDSTKARLEMVHEGNPRVLQEYENRGKEIERERGRLGHTSRKLEETEQSIGEIRQKWEPELDRLVGQISEAFSENFAKINCAGQVEVYKDEDFANWAIQIQVKFREHEELSVLDSHRQSGGERAVSTIFYLMALQSLARAPFRVVDEINQGMDPRNERMVHTRMVDIACSQHTSQYFLITPKLLPNLLYHANMKVHCIASGEYMPEGQGQLDFSKLAQKALEVYGGAGQ